jgi:hypothetical protein
MDFCNLHTTMKIQFRQTNLSFSRLSHGTQRLLNGPLKTRQSASSKKRTSTNVNVMPLNSDAYAAGNGEKESEMMWGSVATGTEILDRNVPQQSESEVRLRWQQAQMEECRSHLC